MYISEHFKFAHDKVAIILSLICNAMIAQGYIPQMVVDTIFVYIIKDKKGDRDKHSPVTRT